MIVLVASVCLMLNVSPGVSINDVVRFICKGCIPKPNECCVGTILSSHYIITSNYCAKMCQLVEIDTEIYQLNKYDVFPYAETFVMGYHFNGPNTIALVNVNMKLNQNTSFIKLASVDVNSLIGSEAIIPDTDKYRLAEIKHCGPDLSHLMKYYVCAGEKYFEDCYIRQGTPLIIDDTLLGIMAIQDSNNCEYSERRFIAIAPIIYWIKYILDTRSYKKLSTLQIRHYQSNIVKHKTYSKRNTVSRRAKHVTNYNLTHFLKKNQMKALKKSITPTKSKVTKQKSQLSAAKKSTAPKNKSPMNTKSTTPKNKSQMNTTKKYIAKTKSTRIKNKTQIYASKKTISATKSRSNKNKSQMKVTKKYIAKTKSTRIKNKTQIYASKKSINATKSRSNKTKSQMKVTKKYIAKTKSTRIQNKTQIYASKKSISATKSRSNKNKSQMKVTKKYITMSTKKRIRKDKKQNKKYKTMNQMTKKSTKVSQKAFLTRKIKAGINKAKQNIKGAIIKTVKPKLMIKRIKKQNHCSRLTSDYIIITEKLKTKTSTKKQITKKFSSTTNSYKYKSKQRSLPNPKSIKKKRKNIKSPKTNKIFQITSPASIRQYPAKKNVIKIYKTTKFGTTKIKNEGSSLRLFSLTPSSLTLYEEPLILTKNNNNATTIEIKQVTKPTNAFDWFKNAFKNMSNNPQPLLVLNMPRKTTEFIDLT